MVACGLFSPFRRLLVLDDRPWFNLVVWPARLARPFCHAGSGHRVPGSDRFRSEIYHSPRPSRRGMGRHLPHYGSPLLPFRPCYAGFFSPSPGIRPWSHLAFYCSSTLGAPRQSGSSNDRRPLPFGCAGRRRIGSLLWLARVSRPTPDSDFFPLPVLAFFAFLVHKSLISTGSSSNQSAILSTAPEILLSEISTSILGRIDSAANRRIRFCSSTNRPKSSY